MSDKDFMVAQSLLQQIVESFEDAEKVSKRYQRRQLRAMASRRQKSTGFVQKARWALYEKRKFDTMISEITEFVGKLVDLFPIAKESQIPLCEMELLAIEDAQDLATLKTLAGPDDDILHQSVEAELKRRGHIVRNWNATDNADVWVGDENEYGVESKGHHVSEFTVSGSAKVRLGNNNKRR
jgi:Prion-inhibition and propagation